MNKTKWLLLGAGIFIAGGIGVAILFAILFGLPVYKSDQVASAHPGYRRNTLTHGTNVFVNDYEEASLQLATTEPAPVIGRRQFGDGKICAIPGQPVSAYIAGDVGSEMPAYIPYRSVNQPLFDWHTAKLLEMSADRFAMNLPHLTTTNSSLLAELVHTLRDDPPTVLPPFPFTSMTNLTTLKVTIDGMPGLLFCPSVYVATNGIVYLAESLMFDSSTATTQLNARWIPARPAMTLWLKSK